MLNDNPTRRLWNQHQQNEYTAINKHKEGLCFKCFSTDLAWATVSDICDDCLNKSGRESILATITKKMYGYCYFCGNYKFEINHINIRLCTKCFRKIADNLKSYNKQGGTQKVDPFWKKMRRKFGKDYKELLLR